MAQVINSNIASLNSQRALNSSQSALNTALQRMSSGLRINSAKDDAAGLAISERFTAQIRGLNQAVRNANDGISLAQTAEGSLSAISNNLQRIRELAVQSRNATNSTSDRAALQVEAAALKSEIDRVAAQTTFNGTNLLDGSFNNQVFQVGANVGQTITVSSIANAQTTALGSYTRATSTGAAATTFTAITGGDFAINGTSIGGIAASASATERAGAVRDAINSVALTTGVYATNDTTTTVSLTSSATFTMTIAGTAAAANVGFATGTATAATTVGFSTLDISTTAGADTAMSAMDAALTAVNSARASLGAIQNRFESAVGNLQTVSENLSASRSRILDADFAMETAALTRAQILQQSGVAMLAQANAVPNNVLSLLR